MAYAQIDLPWTEPDEIPWVPGQHFGARLREIRKLLGRTVKALAAECGLNEDAWWTWEQGRVPRNQAEVVEKVTRCTGVDREWLMWGSEPRDPVYVVELVSGGKPQIIRIAGNEGPDPDGDGGFPLPALCEVIPFRSRSSTEDRRRGRAA